jgi:hypothetical protein
VAVPNTCCSLRPPRHAGASFLPVDTTFIIGRGLLEVLLVPLLAALGALLDILGGDIRQWSPEAALGRARLSRLVVDGVSSGGAAPLLGAILEVVG